MIKPAELLLMLPFSLAPFAPLLRMLPEKFTAVYLFAALGWEFGVFALLFRSQGKERLDSCTIPTTATVADKKSILRSTIRFGTTPIPTYQPVIDYCANGEQLHITSNDGQPKHLRTDMASLS